MIIDVNTDQPQTESGGQPLQPLTESSHPRTFRQFAYVYPVLSRRAGGISVGINLNPDKVCNFDCIYCQVDRSKPAQETFVGLPQLQEELSAVLGGLTPGAWLWDEPEFRDLPLDKRRVVDIAFSGDGEPTTFKNFSEVARSCVALKESLGFSNAKTVLITNATGLDRPDVKSALDYLDSHNGEVWAKLDAGTPQYFALIDNTDFPFQKVLENIRECARRRDVVIQSCFMKVGGAGPSHSEIDAFLHRLKEMVAAGCRIRRVQVYTVARDPAYSKVSSLSDKEVDEIRNRVVRETGLVAISYYGNVPEGRGLMDGGTSASPKTVQP